MVRGKLESITVMDIRHLLIEDPVLVRPSLSIEDLLVKMIDDLRMRHVYVVNEDNVLVGVVRMNAIVRYLFPFAAFIALNESDVILKELVNFGAKTVSDIMDPQPCFVEESTSLSDMAGILIREKINELPVVDKDKRVIGQVNVYEIITEYLKRRRK